MSTKNNQSLWMAVSFLVVGVVAGMVINSRGEGLFASVSDSFGDTSAPDNTQVVRTQNDAAVAAQVDPSQLPTVTVSNDDDAVLGDPNAPVTIVEFSDFQCPYCERFYSESFGNLKKDYIDTGIVKLVYRDFPLPSHKNASMAAQAAECVRRQDGTPDDKAYFRMHDLLFENQSVWSNNADAKSLIEGLAKDQLGVDISACLDSEQMKAEVEADYTGGRGYGLSGTPSFFINGKQIVGAYPYLVFQKIIDSVR